HEHSRHRGRDQPEGERRLEERDAEVDDRNAAQDGQIELRADHRADPAERERQDRREAPDHARADQPGHLGAEEDSEEHVLRARDDVEAPGEPAESDVGGEVRARDDQDEDERRAHEAPGPLVRPASSRRTTGATSVPSSSIARMTFECGIGPTVSWIRNRLCRNSSYWKTIFSTISCGLPTKSAPRSVHSASNCARVYGPHPRSLPIRFITSANGPNASSAA